MDFVCFSINNWEKRKARKQQFMLALSLRRDVGKVMYIEPPLNFWRLLFFPFSELGCPESRKRWQRALLFKTVGLSDKLFLFTPVFFIPFSFRLQAVYNLNLYLCCMGINRIVKKFNFKDIVLWLYQPLDYLLLEWFKPRKLCCFDWAEEWADYFREYSAAKRKAVGVLEEKIASKADLVFVVSSVLLEKAKNVNDNSYLLYDGTILELFKNNPGIPRDIEQVKRPIIGYAGTISMRLDIELVDFLSDHFPDCSFVFVGNILIKEEKISLLSGKKNIFFTGAKSYDELPGYLMNFDACILPYVVENATPSPTKIYDYLASGKPVVTTFLPELERFGDVIKMAATKEEFAGFISQALADKDDSVAAKRLAVAYRNSWADRVNEIIAVIGKNHG